MRLRLRSVSISLFVGLLSVSVAWAAVGLVPVAGIDQQDGSADEEGNWFEDIEVAEESDEAAAEGELAALGPDQVYAGAHKVSIYPDPDRYNGIWERDQGTCETLTNPQGAQDHVTDFRVRWLENSNCIYTGGFDLGPAHAVGEFDDNGLWARATAISDGDDTVVLMILDASYYFAQYANMCNDDPTHASDFDEGSGANRYEQDCGFRDLQVSMAERFGYTQDERGELGIEPASFFLASSHAHAAPDFIGAWGGVPRWYMQQVEDAMRAAVYGAIESLQPTYVEADEILFRAGNNSRRRHYHGAEEAGAAWLRFVAEKDAGPICVTPAGDGSETAPGESGGKGKDKDKKPKPGKTPTPEPSCTQPPPDRNAVATIGTYSAHPVNSSNGLGQADLSGWFAKRAEERFGGVGLFFQTGFGNMTSAYNRQQLGIDLAEMIPAIGEGRQLRGNLDVRTTMVTFDQPVTNSALAGGGISGVFDRPMEQRPSAVSVSRDSLNADASRLPHKRCNSASPVTVNSSVSVARIGPVDGGVLITGGPGELFANYTNTIKEKNSRGITFPLSLVNDGLGYIMQSIETDHVARQAVGFVNGPLSEYEDAYSIDACFGDHALEQTLAAMRDLE